MARSAMLSRCASRMLAREPGAPALLRVALERDERREDRLAKRAANGSRMRSRELNGREGEPRGTRRRGPCPGG